VIELDFIVENMFFEREQRLIVDEIIPIHKCKYKMDTKNKQKYNVCK